MRLYHGSVHSVEHPNLEQCRRNTDFGQGFYATTNYEQANRWAILKKNRAAAERAVVTEYEFDEMLLNSDAYRTRHFTGPDQAWLDFVVANRRGEPTEQFDFVMGPVANDSLYATLLLYEQGILSVEATIEQLKTHTLFDQLSFHTPAALATLHFVQIHAV